jgi:hypothetical protein
MSEYVTLVSNVKSASKFNKNTIAEFRTQLGRKFTLAGNWIVGIAEISYTKSWYNVLFPHKIILFDEIGNILDVSETNDIKNFEHKIDELYISSGYYESAQALVNEINSVLSKVTIITPPKLHYNELNNMVTVEPGKVDDLVKVYPHFGSEVENILGLKNRNITDNYYFHVNNDNGIESIILNADEMFKTDRLSAFHPVEISGGYHSLYVYSDIVYPSYIGDTCTQILRVVEVPHKAKFGEQCVIKYENPQYRPVLVNEFESIEISIKDDTGELIPFKFGRAIVTLHFKKL